MKNYFKAISIKFGLQTSLPRSFNLDLILYEFIVLKIIMKYVLLSFVPVVKKTCQMDRTMPCDKCGMNAEGK